MAKINKVLYNIDQTGDTTSEEKKQARDNIEASQVNYINAITPTPTITPGDLNLVTYQSGLHLNDGVGNIAPCLPEPTSANDGQIATVTSEGVKWRANQPPKDIFIDQYCYDLKNIGTNTSVLKTIAIPPGTTKIIGSLDCYPNTGYESLSIVTRKSDNTLYNSSGTVNTTQLLALDDDATTGLYHNTIPFQFKVTGNPNDGMWNHIAIKGQAESVEANYHLSNIMVTFIKES